MEPFAVDDGDDVGLKFNAGYTFSDPLGLVGEDGGVFFRPQQPTKEDPYVDIESFTAGFSISGEVSSDENNTQFDSALNGGADLTYWYIRRLDLSLSDPNSSAGKSSFTRAYPLALQLKPFDFEATQDFDAVDYTAKFRIAGAVPYSDIPGFVLGSSRRFLPLYASTGYTFVQEIEEGGEENLEATNRWDTELAYALPVTEDLDFELRWRGFYDIEDSDFEDLFNSELRYWLDDKHKSSITFGYRNGGLPPEFADESSVRAGFSIRFLGN